MMNKEIGQILGLRTRTSSRLEIANSIEKGLPPSAMKRIKKALELADVQISSALGISAKTMQRIRRSRASLPTQIGDRLYRLAHIFTLASEVLEDKKLAREWLQSPQIGFNNRTPLELMTTEAGAREVEDLLGRMEHGVVS